MKNAKTIRLILGGGILASAAGLALAGAESSPPRPIRAFTLSYDVTVKDLPPDARTVRVWIPIAVSNRAQTVSLTAVKSPVPTTGGRDPEYGNRILYAEIRQPKSATARFTLDYDVLRRVYAGEPASAETGPHAPVARFLRADGLVPIDGRMKALAEEITKGKHGAKEIARAVYDYVFQTLRYDKTGTGWGRGDAVWACDAKRGNCTDFHSLFIALMRAENVPARFEIGLPLPEDARDGVIPGYHCWAEFYVDGEGWIPVDISEAWKAPARHDFFFGHLDANRVQFTVGRDLTLLPRQDAGPLNYFVYPYVEVDGKPYSAIENKFSFHETTPSAPAGGR